MRQAPGQCCGKEADNAMLIFVTFLMLPFARSVCSLAVSFEAGLILMERLKNFCHGSSTFALASMRKKPNLENVRLPFPLWSVFHLFVVILFGETFVICYEASDIYAVLRYFNAIYFVVLK